MDIKRAHGGLDYDQLKKNGINPDEIIDFSVSINPFEPHQNVIKAIRNCSLTRYPDSTSKELREEIAQKENCSSSEILPVNGTSQAIYLIGQSFLDQNSTVIISAPSYSQYENISQLKKSRIIKIESDYKHDFTPYLSRIIQALEKEKPQILWLCNPNNPTGQFVGKQDILLIESVAKKSNTLIVLDEAYIAFTDRDKRYLGHSKAILRLNSMTKDYGIPGLRLGYIQGCEELLNRISSHQPDWSLSAPAQAAGLACLREKEYYHHTWNQVNWECERMIDELQCLDLKVYPTESNFFMVQLGQRNPLEYFENPYAALLQEKLRERNMQIRDCSSFGYSDFIRIGINTKENNDLLLSIIKKEQSIWQ